MIKLIRDNVDTTPLVKFGQNPPSCSRVIAKTSSTNEEPGLLINMCKIYQRNVSIIELIRASGHTSPLVNVD
jgi:hypothetical protein